MQFFTVDICFHIKYLPTIPRKIWTLRTFISYIYAKKHKLAQYLMATKRHAKLVMQKTVQQNQFAMQSFSKNSILQLQNKSRWE